LFGRFPLFEEDILRRLRFRSGQTLPPEPELTQNITEEKHRVEQFLASRGYFDGQAEIFVKPRSHPTEVDLEVVLYNGAGYDLDPTQPLVYSLPFSDEKALPIRDIRSTFHHDRWWERLTCLWLCGEFSLDSLRNDIARLQRRYRDLGYPGARVT